MSGALEEAEGYEEWLDLIEQRLVEEFLGRGGTTPEGSPSV